MNEKLKLTKHQYNSIKYGKPDNLAQAKEYGFPALKSGKDAYAKIKALREERAALKKDRHNLNEPMKGRLEEYLKEKSNYIFSYMRHSVNGSVYYAWSKDNELHIDVFRHIDWSGYSNSYGRPMTVFDYYFKIPRSGIKAIEHIDGVLTAIVRSRVMLGCEISEGYIISVGRSMDDVHVSKTFVCSRDGFNAHGNTPREALKELERKIKVASHEDRLNHLTMDTVISASDYRKITGACKPGTDEFLHRKGISPSDRMTVREVISITEGEWGHNRLIAAVNQ